MPSISYIIPTYNRPRELSDCLQSVLIQTVKPDELIVIDDGDLVTLPFRMELEAAGIRCIHFKKDKPGLTASRNTGVRLAQGDLIFFTDDDVVLYPDYFECLLDTYVKYDGDGRLMGVGGHMANHRPHDLRYMIRWFYNWLFIMGGFREGRVLPSGFTVDLCEVPVLAKHTIEVEFLGGASMSFKRKLFDEFQFCEDYQGYGLGEDKDFCCRVSRVYRLMLNPAARLDHFESPQMRHGLRKQGRQQVLYRYVFFRNFACKRWWNRVLFWYAMTGYVFVRIAIAATSRESEELDRIVGIWEGIRMILRGEARLEPA